MAVAAVNYMRQYRLNFSQIEKSKYTFWYRADNALYLKNMKKILFCSLIDPWQV